MKYVAALLAMFLLVAPARAENEGEFVYKVSTLRADAGALEALLGWIDDVKRSGYYTDAGQTPPTVLRHSQGDQWDLMMIAPIESMGAYYSDRAEKKREKAARTHAEILSRGESLIAFEEDVFAFGPALADFEEITKEKSLFHIEMFHALAGKAPALLEQRRMENAYLGATGQRQNMIFRRAAGADVDVFTIGAHESLAAFAAPSAMSDAEKEAAAKAAGFGDLADISFYLRSLISSHHDTLAGRVE